MVVLLDILYGVGRISQTGGTLTYNTGLNVAYTFKSIYEIVIRFKWEFVFFFSVLIIGLPFIELQEEVMIAGDYAWECALYHLGEIANSFLFAPAAFFFGEFAERWNDVIMYIRECISIAMRSIDELADKLSIDGITDIINIIWDMFICILHFVSNVPSISIPYFSDGVTVLIDFITCFPTLMKDILLTMVRGTIFSESCSWSNDFDPTHKCTLTNAAFPGVEVNHTNCHTFERSFMRCLTKLLDGATPDEIYHLGDIDEFWENLGNDIACIISSLFKRPIFIISGLIDNSINSNGCVTVSDLPDQIVQYIVDFVNCITALIVDLTFGTVNDFFELIFRYLFPIVQQLIDDIFAIRDCFTSSEFASCMNDYPGNCEFDSLVATAGLQTCSDILATCLEDPDILLLVPINQICIDGRCFFDIFTLLSFTLDQVVCGIYSFIECFDGLESPSIGEVKSAFQCVDNSQSPLAWFGSVMSDFLGIFSSLNDLVNTINSQIASISSDVAGAVSSAQSAISQVANMGILVNQATQQVASAMTSFTNLNFAVFRLGDQVLGFENTMYNINKDFAEITDTIDGIKKQVKKLWSWANFVKSDKSSIENQAVTGTTNSLSKYDLSSGFVMFGNDPCISTFRYDDTEQMFYRPYQKYTHPYLYYRGGSTYMTNKCNYTELVERTIACFSDGGLCNFDNSKIKVCSNTESPEYDSCSTQQEYPIPVDEENNNGYARYGNEEFDSYAIIKWQAMLFSKGIFRSSSSCGRILYERFPLHVTGSGKSTDYMYTMCMRTNMIGGYLNSFMKDESALKSLPSSSTSPKKAIVSSIGTEKYYQYRSKDDLDYIKNNYYPDEYVFTWANMTNFEYHNQTTPTRVSSYQYTNNNDSNITSHENRSIQRTPKNKTKIVDIPSNDISIQDKKSDRLWDIKKDQNGTSIATFFYAVSGRDQSGKKTEERKYVSVSFNMYHGVNNDTMEEIKSHGGVIKWTFNKLVDKFYESNYYTIFTEYKAKIQYVREIYGNITTYPFKVVKQSDVDRYLDVWEVLVENSLCISTLINEQSTPFDVVACSDSQFLEEEKTSVIELVYRNTIGAVSDNFKTNSMKSHLREANERVENLQKKHGGSMESTGSYMRSFNQMKQRDEHLDKLSANITSMKNSLLQSSEVSVVKSMVESNLDVEENWKSFKIIHMLSHVISTGNTKGMSDYFKGKKQYSVYNGFMDTDEYESYIKKRDWKQTNDSSINNTKSDEPITSKSSYSRGSNSTSLRSWFKRINTPTKPSQNQTNAPLHYREISKILKKQREEGKISSNNHCESCHNKNINGSTNSTDPLLEQQKIGPFLIGGGGDTIDLPFEIPAINLFIEYMSKVHNKSAERRIQLNSIKNKSSYNNNNNNREIGKMTSNSVSSNFDANAVILKTMDFIIWIFRRTKGGLEDAYNELKEILFGLDYYGFLSEDLKNFLITLVTCQLPDNIDGTLPFNPFCFPLLPESLFDWVVLFPAPYFPIQIPWPDELIRVNCTKTYNGDPRGFHFHFSNNCGKGGDASDGPFCDICDYCPREYYTCKEIGMGDALDVTLYLLAITPRLINGFTEQLITYAHLSRGLFMFGLSTIMVTGPYVITVGFEVLLAVWTASLIIDIVTLGFIAAVVTVLLLIFLPGAFQIFPLFFIGLTLLICAWVVSLFVALPTPEMNIIQWLIDGAIWLNTTPIANWILPDLNFLIERFERFNYDPNEPVPSADTFCLFMNMTNVSLAFFSVFLSIMMMVLAAKQTGQALMSTMDVIFSITDTRRRIVTSGTASKLSNLETKMSLMKTRVHSLSSSLISLGEAIAVPRAAIGNLKTPPISSQMVHSHQQPPPPPPINPFTPPSSPLAYNNIYPHMPVPSAPPVILLHDNDNDRSERDDYEDGNRGYVYGGGQPHSKRVVPTKNKKSL
jgi:hypothetical protein